MAQIYTAQQQHKGSFKADALKLSFNGDSLGSLAQGINVTFTQQVSMMYELGTSNVYYVGGRCQGQAQVSRVIGPAGGGGGGGTPVSGYGDICKPANIQIDIETGGCSTAQAQNLIMKAAVLVSYAISATSQEVVINNQLSYQFIDMTI